MKLAELIAEGWHEVTHLDLPTLVRRAYDMSAPAGMKWLKDPDTLTREEVDEFLSAYAKDPRFALKLDYVRGCSMKLRVWRADDDPTRLFVQPSWYDHTPEQLAALLAPTTQEV